MRPLLHKQVSSHQALSQVAADDLRAGSDRRTNAEPTELDHPTPERQPLSPRNRQKAHALGLTSATGLVIGSIVGTGVFTTPAVLAGAGTMGIIVLGVIAVGAMLLATLFGQLTKRVPNSDGGLYAFIGVEAVVDKGLTANLLARDLDADALKLLTDVSTVEIDVDTPTARAIRTTSSAALRALPFRAGSMGPKVEAA